MALRKAVNFRGLSSILRSPSYADEDGLHYSARIVGTDIIILFRIPLTEITGGIFENEMKAKHLIRWMLE